MGKRNDDNDTHMSEGTNEDRSMPSACKLPREDGGRPVEGGRPANTCSALTRCSRVLKELLANELPWLSIEIPLDQQTFKEAVILRVEDEVAHHLSTGRVPCVTNSEGGLCPDRGGRTGRGACTLTRPRPPPTPGSGQNAGCWLSPSPGGEDSSLGHWAAKTKHHCHLWGPPTTPASGLVTPDNTSLWTSPMCTLPSASSGLPPGSEPAAAKL